MCIRDRDYLEKVIQMPIQIPNIQRSDLRNALFERLDEIIADFKELGYNQKMCIRDRYCLLSVINQSLESFNKYQHI